MFYEVKFKLIAFERPEKIPYESWNPSVIIEYVYPFFLNYAIYRIGGVTLLCKCTKCLKLI